MNDETIRKPFKLNYMNRCQNSEVNGKYSLCSYACAYEHRPRGTRDWKM